MKYVLAAGTHYKADLHTYSTISDGGYAVTKAYTPADLV